VGVGIFLLVRHLYRYRRSAVTRQPASTGNK
jgi:hypothetical protein